MFINEGRFYDVQLCLTDNHYDAQTDVEHLREVLSTGEQIHSRAVDKGRPSVQQVTPISYYAIRFRPKNVRWSQIR
jgi:methylphosphotriester-DNA--protein-cysteine methyltransferase